MYKPLQALGLVRTRIVIPALFAEACFFLPHETTTYSDLVTLLHNSFAGLRDAASLDIVYRDDEGDAIRVKTDPELREALRLGQTLAEPLTLQVTPVRAPAPAPEPAAAVPSPAPEPVVAAAPEQPAKTKTLTVEIQLPDLSTLTLEADAADPIASIKRLLAERTGIPVDMQALFTPAEAAIADAAAAHHVHQAWCDGCDATIVGVRYKCLVCPDFDFDSACYERHMHSGRELHDATHEFRAITGTVDAATTTAAAAPVSAAEPHAATGRRGCPRRQQTPRVSHNATCDSCRAFIRGIRYKCVNCADFDLCERCESRNADGALHTREHLFVKIRRPISFGYRHTQPLYYDQLEATAPAPAPTPAPAPAPALVTPTAAPAAAVERLADIEKRLADLRAEVKQLARAEAAKKRKEEATKRKQEAAAARRAEQRQAAAARAEAERREAELQAAEAARHAAEAAEAAALAAAQAAAAQAAAEAEEAAAAQAAAEAVRELSQREQQQQYLAGMGFTNAERNEMLLQHFNGDLQSVVEALLGEM